MVIFALTIEKKLQVFIPVNQLRDKCEYVIKINYTITISKVMIFFSCQAFGERVFGKWKLVISLGVAFSAFGSGLCNVFAASR